MPFSVHQAVDHPLSLYGATKKANELMAHTYAHLYGLPVTGLRFFTVYGPWGRPDMSVFIFTQKILNGDPIDVFNHGNHSRDFTYIDDIVQAVLHSCTAWRRQTLPGAGLTPIRERRRRPQALQHRQPLTGCVDGIHRLHRTRCRQNSNQEFLADAGWRRAHHVRRHQRFRWLIWALSQRLPLEEGIARFVAWYCEYYRQ